jgi:hypothetical protein
LSDCNIVPCAVYSIESVADTNYPDGPYSQPLVLATTRSWGDVFDPAGGVTNVIDIGEVTNCVKGLSAWRNHTWCDLHGRSAAGGADALVNVIDIAAVVDALKGLLYSYPAPTAPQNCAP